MYVVQFQDDFWSMTEICEIMDDSPSGPNGLKPGFETWIKFPDSAVP